MVTEGQLEGQEILEGSVEGSKSKQQIEGIAKSRNKQ